MMGSWLFFNSIATGAEKADTPAAAEVTKPAAQDTGAPAGKCEKNHKHRGHHLWEKLNLTEAQKKQIHSIIDEARPKIKPLKQNLKAGRDQLRALTKNGEFDEAKVRAIAKGQADIRTELIVEKQRVKSKIFAVLTPEQRAKAEELREKWRTHRAEKFEHHKD